MLVVDEENVPHIILRSLRDIAADEELLFDYGDRDAHSLELFPWLDA